MSFDALQAARAYGGAARAAISPPSSNEETPEVDFGSMVRSALGDAHSTIARAETLTSQAAMGRADLVDVVTAVAAAEVTLETVISVRDQVVQAYQEILRMPI